MNKKIVLVVILILGMCIFVGCSKKEETKIGEVSENTVSGEVVQVSEDQVFSEEDRGELEELSETLSVEMANGNFDNTVAIFSEMIKTQLDKETLVQSYAKTVEPLGAFVSYETTIPAVESKGNLVVQTVLRYEKNGVTMYFTYNADKKIDGMWINYYTLSEAEDHSAIFDEVEIKIGADPYVLDGILTIPKNVENPKLVILVQGSGPNDMNETIGAVSNQPFLDIAQGLAEKGIASIRYNKRYYQYPNAATDNVTIQEEVLEDVNYAIEYALTSEEIECDGVYVIGHSLGGMLAPYIAATNDSVKGMVSLAGSPRKLEDIILDQNVRALEASKTEITEEEYNSMLQLVSDEVASVKNVAEGDTTYLLGIGSSYWYSLNQINTAEVVKTLTIPMLFLQGEADFQVYADIDFEEWKTLLDGMTNAEFVLYPELNHLFMKTNGKTDTSEYDIQGKVSREVIDDMAEWIIKN